MRVNAAITPAPSLAAGSHTRPIPWPTLPPSPPAPRPIRDAQLFEVDGKKGGAICRDLVREFGNRPWYYRNSDGCGSRNCFTAGVKVYGSAHWQFALQTILFATQRSPGGQRLPHTVALRLPKTSSRTRFDWNCTLQRSDELQLTLRAAALGIAPPVHAAFPVTVFSEKPRIVVEHGYGYVFEDGWTEFDRLLSELPQVHASAHELHRARELIEASVVQLLTDVAQKADYFLLDVKSINMVGRRVSNATLEYEVRMVDFSPEYVAEANLHANATSHACVFFVNALLFLNQVMGKYPRHAPMFCNLARMVERAWRGMPLGNGSFCALLDADTRRVYEALPNWTDLVRVPAGRFQEMLRFTFYRMLQQYGDRDLIMAADTVDPTRFITRYVRLLVARYASQAISTARRGRVEQSTGGAAR